MSDISKVIALLDDDDVEKRIAAAVVLGAIGVKDAKAQQGLERLLAKSPEEQKAALDAFARIGSKRVLARVFDLLAKGGPLVRDAAMRALVAAGPDVVDDISARREKAGDVEKQRLDQVLATLGGADAFKALLDGLESSDDKTARAAALAVRDRVLAADKRTRTSYAKAALKALEKPGERSAPHEAALLKILGWCEDESMVPLLLARLDDPKKASAVRQEALIALRFAIGQGAADKKVVEGILDVAAGSDLALARTATDMLTGMPLEAGAVPKLLALAQHRDVERARFAVLKIKDAGGPKAADTLVDVILRAERATAELAREQLSTMQEATKPAMTALLDEKYEKDMDRARLLADVLRPRAKDLGKAQVQKLIDVVVERLADTGRHYEACLAVARAADAEATADALRALAAKLKKSKKDERAEHVLILLTHTDGATADDRLRRAVLALQKSRLDARPEARARDEAVKLFEQIAASVDVAGALKKDKSTTVEQLFYLGFHFAEQGDPLGEALLNEVIARGPRTKLAKAAKNKLALEADA